MNKTKKIIMFTLIYFISTICLIAEDMGKLLNYTESVTLIEKNAIIKAQAEGVTNDKGYLYLPLNKKAKASDFKIVKGTLLSNQGQVQNIYGRKVMAYKFSEAHAHVSIEQNYTIENFFKGKKAKLKYSHPGNVKKLSYVFVNTAPIEIEKYKVSLSIPNETELYSVVKPERSSKKKTFEIMTLNGLKTVQAKKSGLAPSDDFEIKIRLYNQSSNVKIVLWILVILLGAFLLYKRRDVFTNNA